MTETSFPRRAWEFVARYFVHGAVVVFCATIGAVTVGVLLDDDDDDGPASTPPPETTTTSTTAPDEWAWIGSTDPVTGIPVRCLVNARLGLMSCRDDERPEATAPPR